MAKIDNKVASDIVGKKVAKAGRKLNGKGDDEVWGPSTNPATNLIIQDLILRAAGRLTRTSLEKGLLRRRYGGEHAKKIIENRSLVQTLLAYGATKYATRSIPGALLVGTAVLGKTLFDRSLSRAKSRRKGDEQLVDQAEE
ncbi:hypothetical protein GCM10010923_03260 [Blastomonas marina]|uniref:Uncharacterized protein n=1 Tax=Blastomonas marina TaxID=1867408 RepID=A0ABQ1F3S5_9SPHN|nr:hypothetical protein [Blastomonas marina]GFZ98453.1 hypothetical protein GCM10010923_03260 [Blastomonas marina]